MGLKSEIEQNTKSVVSSAWRTRKGITVPSDTSLTLNNDGVYIEATVLYADLVESTQIVQNNHKETAAEIYKIFLKSICKVIRNNGGEITAFDGDRVMAVFIGSNKNTVAAKTALQINYAIKKIVEPQFKLQYPDSNYEFKFTIGLDSSEILVVKTGIRGANDLVWIGDAANIAAKLSSIRENNKPIWITEDVYDKLAKSSKVGGVPERNMWTRSFNSSLNSYLYSSTWTSSIS